MCKIYLAPPSGGGGQRMSHQVDLLGPDNYALRQCTRCAGRRHSITLQVTTIIRASALAASDGLI